MLLGFHTNTSQRRNPSQIKIRSQADEDEVADVQERFLMELQLVMEVSEAEGGEETIVECAAWSEASRKSVVMRTKCFHRCRLSLRCSSPPHLLI